MTRILPLVVFITIAQSAGLIGSLFTATGVNSWFVTLAKPDWNPPGWVFGPVWITLYTLMGVSSYMVWQKKAAAKRTSALWIYGIHLFFNALWSALFFGLRSPGLAFAEIVILLGLIFVTTVQFWRINRWAGLLFVPYIAWTLFAALLNYTIWQLNR